MDIQTLFTDVTVRLVDFEKLKAFVDIVVANNFVCKGFKVMDGPRGLWVSMPSRLNNKTNEYEDIFHPITSQGRTDLFELILKKYDEKLKEEKENPSNNSAPAAAAPVAPTVSNEDTPEEEIPF